MGVDGVRIVVVKKKTLLVALVGLLACAAAVALTVWLSDAGLLPTMARMAQVEEYELNVLPGKKRELPVYSVERPDQKIALTIDAAWEDDKTAFILETLARYDVKATFFLCGVWGDVFLQSECYLDEYRRLFGHGYPHAQIMLPNKEDAEGCACMAIAWLNGEVPYMAQLQ